MLNVPAGTDTSLPAVYCDWSMRRGVTAVFESATGEYMIFKSLGGDSDSLLNALKTPHLIILERTFESFNLAARRAFTGRADRDGHTVLCVPTRMTTKARYRAGLGVKASDTYLSDFEDAKAIRFEALAGMALVPPSLEPDEEYLKVYNAVKNELRIFRSTGDLADRPRAEGFKLISEKTVLAQELISRLPGIHEQDLHIQQALGSSDGKSYNETIVAAVGVLARHCASRRMFDRVSGMHAHAYGSQVRSDLMFWGWTGGGKRGKLIDLEDIPVGGNRTRRDELTLSEYRNAVRWLYRQLRNL